MPDGLSIDTNQIETIVTVDNGETIVLGGVFKHSFSFAEDKVPFFGDLPLIGYFFKNQDTQKEKSELLIFITPKILKETI